MCLVLEACREAKREDERKREAKRKKEEEEVDTLLEGTETFRSAQPTRSVTHLDALPRIYCPRGLMDKASDSGSEDCQFDSDRG